MIYSLATILVLTLIFAYLHRTKVIAVCPICAGTVVTWLVGIIGIYTNQAWADPLVVAILLGASLGAVADKHGTKFGFVWKTLVVLLGLPAIFYLVQKQIWPGTGVIAVLLALTLFFSRKKPPSHGKSKDIFKECC